MLRVRMPGGVITPKQWLALDRHRARLRHGTPAHHTRQTIQLHGVISRTEVHDAGDRPDPARHDRGLRRREPQRDVQTPTRSSRARMRSRCLQEIDQLPRTGAVIDLKINDEDRMRARLERVGVATSRCGSRRPQAAIVSSRSVDLPIVDFRFDLITPCSWIVWRVVMRSVPCRRRARCGRARCHCFGVITPRGMRTAA